MGGRIRCWDDPGADGHAGMIKSFVRKRNERISHEEGVTGEINGAGGGAGQEFQLTGKETAVVLELEGGWLVKERS